MSSDLDPHTPCNGDVAMDVDGGDDDIYMPDGQAGFPVSSSGIHSRKAQGLK